MTPDFTALMDQPWPLPLTQDELDQATDEYQRDAIADAQSEMAKEAMRSIYTEGSPLPVTAAQKE